MDAAEGEGHRYHTHVFPIQLFLLLCQYHSLNKTVWHVLAGVHTCFHSIDHGTVDFHDVIMKPTATGSGGSGNPLEWFDEVDNV